MTYVGNQTGGSLSLLSHVDTSWDNSLVVSAVTGSNHHVNLKASGVEHWGFQGVFPVSCLVRKVTHILKSKSLQLTTAMFPWNFSELCLNYCNFPILVISLKMKYLPHLCERELLLYLFSRIYFSIVPWNIWHSLGPWQRRDQSYPFQISLWLCLVIKQTK